MENKHTPGPKVYRLARRIGSERYETLLPNETMSMGFIDLIKVVELTPTIAAAPDLLEALEMMRDNETIHAVYPSPIWATMTAAIAKARGQ